MPLAEASRRGAALYWRLAVNGIHRASISGITVLAASILSPQNRGVGGAGQSAPARIPATLPARSGRTNIRSGDLALPYSVVSLDCTDSGLGRAARRRLDHRQKRRSPLRCTNRARRSVRRRAYQYTVQVSRPAECLMLNLNLVRSRRGGDTLLTEQIVAGIASRWWTRRALRAGTPCHSRAPLCAAAQRQHVHGGGSLRPVHRAQLPSGAPRLRLRWRTAIRRPAMPARPAGRRLNSMPRGCWPMCSPTIRCRSRPARAEAARRLAQRGRRCTRPCAPPSRVPAAQVSGYGHPYGFAPLREYIATHIEPVRHAGAGPAGESSPKGQRRRSTS